MKESNRHVMHENKGEKVRIEIYSKHIDGAVFRRNVVFSRVKVKCYNLIIIMIITATIMMIIINLLMICIYLLIYLTVKENKFQSLCLTYNKNMF